MRRVGDMGTMSSAAESLAVVMGAVIGAETWYKEMV